MVAAIYQGFIKDEAGNIIEGASVEVRDQDTNALVDLWSNRATTSTKTNPTTTDANGYYFFYRTAGRYKITVTSATYSATFNNVPIGTAQEYDTGTGASDIPLNSDLATVAGTGDYDDLINKPALGTIVTYNYGTAGGEIQTNSLNDARFFRIGNNLSEGTASAMRANLQLGSGDAVTFASVAAATIDTGQGAVECYAMDQAVRTTDVVGFSRMTLVNANATNEILLTGTEYSNIYSETLSGFDIGTNSTGGASYLRLLTENTERMRIDSSGNVGIGTSSPALKLDVTDNSALPSFRVTNNDATNGFGIKVNAGGTAAGRYGLMVNDIADTTTYFVVSTATGSVGNVGIGTSSPSAKLDVAGAITATTWAKVGSYTVATVPSAATAGAGAMIYVSDETGGAVLAFSDGTDWRRSTDRAVIS